MDWKSFLGWLGFGVVAVLWSPLWFGSFLDALPAGTALGIGFGLILSVLCALIRLMGAPRIAWATLTSLATATVLISLWVDLGEGPDDPWEWRYQVFTLGMAAVQMHAALIFLYVVKRRTDHASKALKHPSPDEPTRNQTITRLWLRLLLVPTAIASPIAALVYGFQDYITPFVESKDFCENPTILDIAAWTLPKVIVHCDLITKTHLRDHPSSDIVIIIDIFVALVCLLLLFNSRRIFVMVRRYHSEEFEKNWNNSGITSPWKFWPIIFGGCLAVIFAFYWVFISSPLEPYRDGHHVSGAMFGATWGLGAALQVFDSFCFAFFSLGVVNVVHYRLSRAAAHTNKPSPPIELNMVRVAFFGDVREYFGIWIVNAVLSVVTFGVYSAWAKARTRQYFLGNTIVGGRSFGYHATGRQILMGRVIVLGGIIALAVLAWLLPGRHALWVVVALSVTPIIINHSMRFNAAMTSWSGLRFRFEMSHQSAMLIFGIYPLLSALTAFLTFPYVARAAKRYTIGNSWIGERRFVFDSRIGPFYRAFFLSAAWVVASFIIFFFLIPFNVEFFVTVLAMLAAIVVVIFPPISIHGAFVRNAVYAGTALEGGHQFASTVSGWKLAWIALGNAAATIVSFGLLLPWARIRMMRYLCANTWVRPAGSLDQFAGRDQAGARPLGAATPTVVA